MSFPLNAELKKDFKRYIDLSLKLVNDLHKEGKYNPFHARHIKKIDGIMDYASKCVESHNAFYFPMEQRKEEFFKDLKKYN